MIIAYIAFFHFLLAGLIHVYFFYIESLAFTRFAHRFGVEQSSLPQIKVWAFNQGIYNLMLAIQMFVGLSMIYTQQRSLAGFLVGFSGLTMIVAGICLYVSAPHLRRASIIQILPPTIGFIFLAAHIAL
jgi:putative membrane protein